MECRSPRSRAPHSGARDAAGDAGSAALARELHDVLGQILTGLQMEVEWLADHAEDPGAVRRSAEKIRRRLEETLSSVRSLAGELRDGKPDRVDLALTLQRIAVNLCRRMEVECTVTLDCHTSIPPMVSAALRGIAREALTNIVRHSEAKRAWLRLQEKGGSLVLEVEDDGRGMLANGQVGRRSEGLGIVGMRERAGLLGGWLAFGEREGGGTRVIASLPLPPETEDE